MKRLLTLALFLSAAVPLFALPAPTGHLANDFTHTLSELELTRLDGVLRAYEARTTHEIAVVVVPSLEGQSVEQYAGALFEAWGIGKRGQDNGVLLLYMPSTTPGQGRIRIEVGRGVESAIPDGRAGDIIRSITPALKAHRMGDGLLAGVSAIMAQLDRQAAMIEAPVQVPAHEVPWGLALFALVLAGGAGIWFVVVIVRDERRRQREYERIARHRERDRDEIESRIFGSLQRGGGAVRHASPTGPTAVTPGRTRRAVRSSDDDEDDSRRRSASSSDWGSSSSPSSPDPSPGFDFGGGQSGGGGASGAV